MNSPLLTSTLIEHELERAPDHPILPNARQYELRQLRFIWGYEEGPDGLLMLEMSTHDEYVRLQFSAVMGIVIPSDHLLSQISIRILDCRSMRSRMPASIRVRHPQGGGLEFWAEAVERID